MNKIKKYFYERWITQGALDWCNDRVLELQQELNEYKLIFKGKYLITAPEGTFENPDFWEAMGKIANTELVEVFIKQRKEK